EPGGLVLRRREGRLHGPRRRPRAAAADVPGQAGRHHPGRGEDPRPERARAAGQELPGELTMADVLTLTGLSWSVGGSAILSGVDLAVGEGEFVAVIGPNGAGNNSVLNLISGLTRATAGTIALDGADITHEAPHKRARRGIG